MKRGFNDSFTPFKASAMITQGRFTTQPDADDADPVARLRLQIEELQAYFRQQWAVRADRAMLGFRRLILSAILGAVALVALAAWIVTAVVLLLQGAAGGLASVLDGRLWL